VNKPLAAGHHGCTGQKTCRFKNLSLEVNFQPIVRIVEDVPTVFAYEALSRFFDASGSLFLPDVVLPALSSPEQKLLFKCVTQHVIAILARHPDIEYISVNIQPSLLQDDLGFFVLDMLNTFGVEPSRLALEFCEQEPIDTQKAEVIATCNSLHARGVKLFLDDIFTGYSHIQTIKRLPISGLKIDQSVLKNLKNESHQVRDLLLRMVSALMDSSYPIIIEGIESLEDLELVDSTKLHYQGYYFGRPAPWKG